MRTKCLNSLVMAALVVLGAGCAVVVVGAAAGAGAYIWENGELRSSQDVTFDKAWDATLAAMNDLHYAVTDKQKYAVEATVLARGDGDKKIRIALEKASGTLTKVRVRVGTLGDKPLSRTILDKIKSHF